VLCSFDFQGIGSSHDHCISKWSECGVCLQLLFIVSCDYHQVRAAVQEICSLCVKDVRLIKDKTTGVSRGFCFVELSSIEVGVMCSWWNSAHGNTQ
jgi:RNA recognition motif-containing protein